jgi:drug/metabolite transporter (DMT)-like permease
VRFVAYIVTVPTILAYIANAWALGRSSATLVTIYIYLQPVLTAALAWVQLGQTVSERLVVSALLIVAGVLVVVTRGALSVGSAAGR